ncbi:hypothetical protein J6590_035051 [Homalodisca vitripennis]|nr:hypothetical protein J6590_035051 [Homalodisca vitripennis]
MFELGQGPDGGPHVHSQQACGNSTHAQLMSRRADLSLLQTNMGAIDDRARFGAEVRSIRVVAGGIAVVDLGCGFSGIGMQV